MSQRKTKKPPAADKARPARKASAAGVIAQEAVPALTPAAFIAWRVRLFGDKVKGEGQARAAQALGVTVRQISRFENGHASIDIRTRLAMSALHTGLRPYTGADR